MPDQPAVERSAQPSAATRYIRALKVPVAVLCLIATGLVAYFLLYVQRQTDYLIGRNFRVLATAAAQIEAALDSAGGVIGRLSSFDDAKASGAIPMLSLVADPQAASRVGPFVARFKEPATSRYWLLANDTGTPAEASALALDVNRLLQQQLAGYAREGLFDSILVASNTGRVVFQTGDATLRLTTLDTLRTIHDKGVDHKVTLEGLPGASDAFDVVVAGQAYKLFVEPCCQSVHTAADGDKGGERGWVVGGLVAQSALRSAGYAVSFSFMALVAGALLLAFFSWPFVKLTLIGPLQRIRVHDVVLVGSGTLLGGALITIFVLDVYSYAKLGADLDAQLESFASSVDARVTAELDAAVAQLHTLERQIPQIGAGQVGPQVPYLSWYLSTADRSIELSQYPQFESFTIIDPEGAQRQKWSFGDYVPSLINVRDREYFTHWQAPKSGDTRFVAAVRSRTTGSREVVISVPTDARQQLRTAATTGPWVASLAIRDFRSLLETTVIPGFGFVIVDDNGELLFHSDRQHVGSENVFAETDNNRRLRALIAAHQSGRLNTRYWGEDYRAFVRRMSGSGLEKWSLVTYYDQHLVRTVNAEWLLATIFFIVFYAGVYVVAALGIHVCCPAYRAPWLWPDHTRSRDYLDLLLLEIVLIVGWVVGLLRFSNGELLWTAYLLPFAGWGVAYLCLSLPDRARAARLCALVATLLLLIVWLSHVRPHLAAAAACLGSLTALFAVSQRRRARGPGWVGGLPIVKLCYGAAALGLAILTIVLPTASFFRIAHGVQAASFVKYGQLRLALAVREREARHEARPAPSVARLDAARFDELSGKRRAFDQLGVYDAFFFSTTLDQSASCDAAATADHGLPEIVEERLPLFSEASVQLRELIHDRAPGRWSWCRHDNQLVMTMAGSGERYRSNLPRLVEAGAPQWPLPLEMLAILGGILIVAAAMIWAIRFLMHHVFVIDLVDPLWAPTVRAPVAAGANLLILAPEPLDAAFFDRDNFVVLDLGAVAVDDMAGWERGYRAALERADEWKSVLVEGVERTANDPELRGAALRLLERVTTALNRTVILISTLPAARLIGTPAPVAERDADERWTQLLMSFAAVPVHQPAATSLPSWTAAGEPAPRFAAALWRANTGFLRDEAEDLYVKQAWQRLLPEGRALDASQLLVEADERLERYYRLLWGTCSAEQKLVLLQIAQERLVNEKNRRIVRLLMARRLIVRRPNIRLVSETFRRFVLSACIGSDATRLEGQSSSAWDTVRWPFMVLLVVTVGFFFTTQHELFDSTIGIVTGVAAGVPTILRVISLFGEKGGNV